MLPLDLITANDWREFIEANNLPRLGSGMSRTAWALNDDYVVKVCHSDTDQHQSEVERWRNATPRERQYLAPIVASGPAWSVMARAKETLFERFGRSYYSKATTRTSGRLVNRTGIGDLHVQNIGYFPKSRIKYKVIDYGL